MFEKICQLIEDVDDHPNGHFVIVVVSVFMVIGIVLVLITFVLPVLIFAIIALASVCVPIATSIFQALMDHFGL